MIYVISLETAEIRFGSEKFSELSRNGPQNYYFITHKLSRGLIMNIIVMWGALCETFLVVEFKKASNVKHRINLAFLEGETQFLIIWQI